MEPTQALLSIETVLRLVVREILGEDWLKAPGAPAAKELERSRTRDAARRSGVHISEDLLEYTETRQLTQLIRDNWEDFEPVFLQQERTFGLLQVVDDERFSVAHSRELVPFERELLSGIAGQLRQQVAVWRNRDDPSTSYYPRIEKVRDNYGVDGDEMEIYLSATGKPRLDVGETLRFSCSAFGDQKHPVRWYVKTGYWSAGIPYGHYVEEPVAVGDQVELELLITEDEVSENLSVHIAIDTESRWKRYSSHPQHDDIRHFMYAVNPPRD